MKETDLGEVTELAQGRPDSKGGVCVGSMVFMRVQLPRPLPGNGPAWFREARLPFSVLFLGN